MRNEQVSIQQGNIYYSLSTSNRILMSSTLVKSVMLFDMQHNKVTEMASYGEYMTFVKPPHLDPGEVKTRLIGTYQVVTFIRFRERPNLVAAFKIESPDSAIFFVMILGTLTTIVIGFALYIGKLARTEELRRIALIKSAMEDLLQEVPPRQSVVDQMPHILNQWGTIRTLFEQLKEKLENSAGDRILAQTSQMLGHDLRAPLGTFERLLLLPDDELPTMRVSIKESLNRLYAMIDALKNSETENIVKCSWSKVDFKPGFESLRAKAEKKKIRLKLPEVIDQSMNLDRNKIERAWLNLASNAIDFATIDVKIEAEIKGHDLFIRVMDDGPGVPEEFVPRLFQRGATLGSPEGSGLGLAYVKQIMRGHGGDVEYRRVNGLTIFECRIPHVTGQGQDYALQNSSELGVAFNSKDLPKIAVCVVPETFAQAIIEYLSHAGIKYLPILGECSGANIVISNDEEILLKSLCDGHTAVEVIDTVPLEKTLWRLKKRFLKD